MRAFHSGLGKQHAIITQNTDLIAMYFGKSCDEGIAIKFLKFIKAGAIDDTRNDLAAIIGLA